MKQVVFSIFLSALCTLGFAQNDSLIITGKIENLSIRQYRQASNVTVARVNLLRADQEMVASANLQPDGSFRLVLPLMFPQEECYFGYGDQVFVPFLASTGTLSVAINADSLASKNTKPIFSGVNAAANNRRVAFDAALAKWLENKYNFKNPLAKTEGRSALKAWEYLRNMRDQKQGFYRLLWPTKPDTLLDKWVEMSLQEEAKALFYIHLTRQNQAIPVTLADTLSLNTTPFLTFTKADCFKQFTRYAAQNTAQQSQPTLSIAKMADLMLRYIPKLSNADSVKLRELQKTKSGRMKDLQWLNQLFEKNGETLQSFVNYELYLKKYAAAYDSAALVFLKTQYYVGNIAALTVRELQQVYDYVQPQLENPFYARSLAEIHQIETRDSAAIRALDRVAFVAHTQGQMEKFVVETEDGISLYQNDLLTQESSFEQVKKMYKGKKIYVLLWDNNDEFSRQELLNARQLRGLLPESELQLVLVCKSGVDKQVWKEAVVKSKVRGLHILCSSYLQDDEWFSAIASEDFPAALLIGEMGKIIKNPAPLPGNRKGWGKIMENGKWRIENGK